MAEDVLKTVTQTIDPEYPDGFMRLGLLYFEQEKNELAAENLLISTRLDNKDYLKYKSLAEAYNRLKKFPDASKAAQACVDLKKKFGGGWYELGVAEMGKGNTTRAKKYFEKAYKDRDYREVAGRKIEEINNPTKYEK